MAAGRVFVVGVGYTGRRLLQRLDGAVGISRSEVTGVPAASLRLDLDKPVQTGIDVQSADSVVYTVPPARDDDEDVRLERLLDNLASPPSRFVYLSTSGVYGNHDGAIVTEDTPINPSSDRALRRAAAEQTLNDWSRESGTALVILRVPGIYGPGRLGTDRLSAGTTVIAEPDAGPGNRIHVRDLGSCIAASLSPDVPAGVYNVGDGDYRSSTWFLSEVARQAGLPEPATVSRDEAMQTFSPMRLSFLKEMRRVDVSRMREILKPEIAFTDPAAGIAASLAAEQAES